MDKSIITETPIDLASILQEVQDVHCGGTALFVGTVRAENLGRRVQKIRYECHVPMAERELRFLVQHVRLESSVINLRAIHRIGDLGLGEIVVVVAAGAVHRDAAFRSCRALIEGIKKTLPIWKKEIYSDGLGSWIGPQASLLRPDPEKQGLLVET